MAIIYCRVPMEAPDPPENLPESDDIPMETPWHRACMNLLIEVLAFFWHPRTDFFVGGNMFLYFSRAQVENRDYRGPDFFVVKGVDGTRPRTTWKVWEEDGRYPDVIIELLSQSTAQADRTTKKNLYEKTFRLPEYFLYDPETKRLEGWRLHDGVYHPIEANDRGWLWSNELELWLATWEGRYIEMSATWLRFYTRDGQLVPTRAESAETRAKSAETRAKSAETELERLKSWLAQQGMTPPDNSGTAG